MADLVPVDGDPFAAPASAPAASPQLSPVDHDPFAPPAMTPPPLPTPPSAVAALSGAGVGRQPKPFNILPAREDPDGSLHFDLSQGVLGAMWRGLNAPADAYNGKFDPMSPEGQARARETAMLINPTNPAIMAGERAVPGVLQSTRTVAPKVPTAEELRTAAGAGYDAARATGAEYPGKTVASAVGDAQNALNMDGFVDAVAPRTLNILRQLQNPPDGAVVTFASLDAARKALGKIVPTPEGGRSDYAAAQSAIRAIDNFVSGAGARSADGAGVAAARGGTNLPVPASAAGAGAADRAGAGGAAAQAEAADLIIPARANAAAAFRSDRLTGIEQTAEERAAAANSGQNLGNALRQRLATLHLSERQSRGFTPAELDAIEQVVRGTATSNTLRYVSNLLGGGGGLGQTTIGVMGAVAGGQAGGLKGAILGALPAVTGAVTRGTYNGLISRQLGKIDEATRMRSPLFLQRQADASLRAEPTDLFAEQLLRAFGLTGDAGSQR